MWQVFAFVSLAKNVLIIYQRPSFMSSGVFHVQKKASKVIRTVKPKINQKPNDKLPNAWEKGIHCSCFEKIFECIENANYITVHKFPSEIRNKPTSSQPANEQKGDRARWREGKAHKTLIIRSNS